MTAGGLLRVVRLNLSRDRRGFWLSAGGVAVGVAAFVFFVALGEGVGAVVRERIFPVSATHLEVIPARISLGAVLGGGKLDEATVARLEHLPGVRRAYRKLELKAPAISRYDGDFFGSHLRMGVELLAVGVEPEYLAGDLPKGVRFEDPGEGGGPIPVVLARQLLEIYNHSFARARGLPRLDASLVTGFRFPMTLGRSYVTRAGGGPSRTVELEVVGLSDRALLGGVTMPLQAVRRLNRGWVKEDEAGAYSAVVLELADAGQAPEVSRRVRAMGFDLDESRQRMADRVGAAVLLTTLALSLLSILILALAAVNIARAAFAEVASRVREIGLMRAVGARRRDVTALFLGEAVAAGLAGALLGIALALGAAWACDLAAAHWLPDFPFKPDSFFRVPLWLLPAALGVALLAALGGAAFPAAAAGRLDPARALAGGR